MGGTGVVGGTVAVGGTVEVDGTAEGELTSDTTLMVIGTGGWHGSVLVPDTVLNRWRRVAWQICFGGPYTLMRSETLNGGILLRSSGLPRIGYAGSAEESHVAALCLHR